MNFFLHNLRQYNIFTAKFKEMHQQFLDESQLTFTQVDISQSKYIIFSLLDE